MSYLAKQKLYYYKKYKVDIWSFFANTLQVIHDNTIYNVYRMSKRFRKIKINLKKTTWEYLKIKKLLEINKLKIVDNDNIKKKKKRKN